MKLKAKIKSILISGNGVASMPKHYDLSCTATTTATTTTTTSVTATTTLTTSVRTNGCATMPRDFPSTSKSMLDLSGRTPTSDSNETNGLQRTRSVWDVGSQSNTSRLRLLSRPLSVVRSERRTRNVSLPALSEEGGPPPRPKRISGIQWAEGVTEEKSEHDSTTSPPSTSSSLSSPITPAPASPALHMVSENDVFVNNNHLTEAQSMFSLAPTSRNSNSSDDEPKGLRKKSASAL